ncbi:MAG: hypothetical protein D6725_13735 [Planctomycetota bacterium]|nr:MAG: hypothetical protein D6725_13735 [Planctomycetota bacterium]
MSFFKSFAAGLAIVSVVPRRRSSGFIDARWRACPEGMPVGRSKYPLQVGLCRSCDENRQ